MFRPFRRFRHLRALPRTLQRWLAGVAVACVALAGDAGIDAAAEPVTHRGGRVVTHRIGVPRLDRTDLRAGETVVVRWTALDPDAEELELVFTLAGEHEDVVRVSPELSGDACRFVWTVPNVGVANARVRLRARFDGRELAGPVGAPFRITADPSREPGRFAYRHGEWWEDPSGEPLPLPGLLMPSRTASLAAHATAPVAALAAPFDVRVARPVATTAAYAVAPPDRPLHADAVARDRLPVPMRN